MAKWFNLIRTDIKFKKVIREYFDDLDVDLSDKEDDIEANLDVITFEKGGGLCSALWSIFCAGMKYGHNLKSKK